MTEETTPPEGEPEEDAPVEEKVNRLEAGLNSLRNIVEEVKEKIVGGVAPPADGEDNGSGGGDSPPSEPSSPREVEADMEAQVQAALEKISADEKHKADHDRLAKEAERPPRQLGKVTQFLWGGGDD